MSVTIEARRPPASYASTANGPGGAPLSACRSWTNRCRTGSSVEGHVRTRADREHVDRGRGERQAVVGLDPRGTDDDRRQTVGRETGGRSPHPALPRSTRGPGSPCPAGQDLRVARRSGELLRRREQGPARREAVSGQADRRALRSDVGGGQEQDRLPCPIGRRTRATGRPPRAGGPHAHDSVTTGSPWAARRSIAPLGRRGPRGDRPRRRRRGPRPGLQRGRHVPRIETEVHRLDLDRPGPMRGELQPGEGRRGHELGIRRRSVEEERDGGDVGLRRGASSIRTGRDGEGEEDHQARADAPIRSAPAARYARPARPGWRNRQTRGSQKPVGFGP